MTTKTTALALLMGLPIGALALDLRAPTLQAVTVEPSASSEAGANGATLRLRDALRQPASDKDAASKPYRLSAEERQRLREQLRSQTADAGRTP